MVRVHLPALALLAGLAAGASAQTVDHGVLEQIFGQPVTTSATGSPKLASDVPATMEIITAEDIRRSGAGDIPTILSRLAGVEVWRWTSGAADVAVRGYNQPMNPRLLVLINGRQVYVDTWGATYWNSLPVQLAEIRQIEVVKGPNTALFGFNALAGVVNIITFNPLYDDVGSATVRVGTQNHREVSAVETLKLSDRAGVRLSAGTSRNDEFDTAWSPSYLSQRVDPTRQSASLDGLFQVSEDAQLGVELTHSRSRQTNVILFNAPSADRTETASGKVTYTAETGLGLVEATAYRNWFDGTMAGGFAGTYDVRHQVSVLRLQDLMKAGADHTVRLMGEYRHNMLYYSAFGRTDVGYDIYSAGGMWDWAITDRLSLTNAARLDHVTLDRDGEPQRNLPAALPTLYTDADFDKRHTEVSFNSGLVYKAGDLDTLRLMVARGLQLPSLIARGGWMMEGTQRGIPFHGSANPYLEPTVAMNYEVSWDRRLPSLDAEARLSLFHQTTDDFVGPPGRSSVQGLSPQGVVYFQFDNVGDSRLSGVEAAMKGRIGRAWTWGASYAFETIDDSIANDEIGQFSQPILFEEGTPRHRINAHLGYTDGPFEADLFATAASSFHIARTLPGPIRAYEGAEVPAFFGLDARLAYRLSDTLTVALEGQSLTQAEYRPNADTPVERRLFLSVRADF